MTTQPEKAGAFSDLYTHSKWRSLRARQLDTEPLCRMCTRQGRVKLATICDHVEPHRGDLEKFWNGPFQSLCKRCHDSAKQSEEKGGSAKVPPHESWG